MIFNKKIFKEIDYGLLISMLIIVIIGIVTIRSATTTIKPALNQSIFLVISIFAGFIVLLVDYTTIGGYYKFLYIFVNILLVLVLIVGTTTKGAKAWLGIGSMGVQPSEFAKLVTIITLAKLMEDMEDINTIKNLVKLAIYALIPMVLIQLQPDTGTNIIFIVTIFSMLFIAGLDSHIVRTVVISVVTLVGGVYIIITQNLDKYITFIKPYQWDRIRVFIQPETDKLGAGYNAVLAKMAIGSGGFFGKGLYNTDLVQGKFIPESYTDFIFSVFAEEWGFLGAIVLFILYLNIIIKGINIARSSKDKFGYYMVTGILAMFAFQILQNIGMDIGLMPITGIPLPFMSSGGSSLLTNIIAVAMILNVGSRRQKINFSRG
jgi:rod shape determining protein RodA